MFLIRHRRLIIFAVAGAMLAGGGLVVPQLHAQTATQSTATQTTTTQTTATPAPKQAPIANFDTFLDAHPAIEKDLKQNPSLLNDAAYLANHPELKTFLASHAAVSAAATKDPKALMHRLDKFEKSGRDIPKSDLTAFDKFLDQHSAIEKDLRKNPSLLTDASYLASHPELKSFLASNPSIQQEITEHPRAFMNAENHFDHHENKIEHQQAKIEHPERTTPPTPPPHPTGHR